MNKQEAENYIYASYLKAQPHQSYEALDAKKRNPEFSREIIQNLCVAPCVVVTGSKGKGSVSSMISQVLQTKMKVGLMTSPHILDFCERIKVNGQDISDEAFVFHMQELKPQFDQVESTLKINECISPMGLQTAVALRYFAMSDTQINILECGKGARYDDVNNTIHQYALINTIFLEHTRELGQSLEAIAENKASVITGQQRCVYVGEQQPEVLAVIERVARERHVSLKRYGKDFYAVNIRYTKTGMMFDVVLDRGVFMNVELPLLGEHQAKNCALALALCMDVLTEIDEEDMKAMLRKIKWPGRMEIMSTDPWIMFDTCIHRESCDNVIKVLKQMGQTNCTAIVGIPDDKDYIGVTQCIQEIASTIILTKSSNPHYKFSSEQQQSLLNIGIKTEYAANIMQAIQQAKQYAKSIVILGTTSLLSDCMRIIK